MRRRTKAWSVAPLAKFEWHNIRNFLDLTLMLFSPIKFGSGNELRSEALALVKGRR